MEDCDVTYRNLQRQIEKMRKKHVETIEQLEELNSKNLLQCYQQNDSLKEELNATKEQAQRDYEQSKFDLQENIHTNEGIYQEKFEEIYEKYINCEKNRKEDQKKFNMAIVQNEQEQEMLINKTKDELDNELKLQIKLSEELRTNISKKQKECEKFNHRRLELESLIKETRNQIEHLQLERESFI